MSPDRHVSGHLKSLYFGGFAVSPALGSAAAWTHAMAARGDNSIAPGGCMARKTQGRWVLHTCGRSGHPTDSPSGQHWGIPPPETATDVRAARPSPASYVPSLAPTPTCSAWRSANPASSRYGSTRAVRARLPLLGALSEEPLILRATKFCDDPRSCIPAGSSVPTQLHLLFSFAKARSIADHAVHRHDHSASGRCSRTNPKCRGPKPARLGETTAPT